MCRTQIHHDTTCFKFSNHEEPRISIAQLTGTMRMWMPREKQAEILERELRRGRQQPKRVKMISGLPEEQREGSNGRSWLRVWRNDARHRGRSTNEA